MSICLILVTACGPSEREQKLANEVQKLKASKIQLEADQKLATEKLHNVFTTQLEELNGWHKKEKTTGESMINDLRQQAQTASTNEKRLKKELDGALSTSSTKDDSITNLQAQVLSLEKKVVQTKEQTEQANISMLTAQAASKSMNALLTQAQAEAKTANALLIQAQTEAKATNALLIQAQAEAKLAYAQLARAQAEANQIPALKGQIAAYENLGAPQDIKIKLNSLAKLERTTRPFVTPKKRRLTKALIKFHNSELDYYVINKGSDHGIKRGDIFSIFRAGKEVGKIKISRTQPLASIADYQEESPKPSTPFKPGDEVTKIQ